MKGDSIKTVLREVLRLEQKLFQVAVGKMGFNGLQGINMGSLTINPLIMDIFAEARSRLGITRKTELRMSDGLLDCAGKVFCEDRTGKGIILIDADIEEYLDEGGIRYLIGHELGHLMHRVLNTSSPLL